jgi:hypothetical protein
VVDVFIYEFVFSDFQLCGKIIVTENAQGDVLLFSVREFFEEITPNRFLVMMLSRHLSKGPLPLKT